ncbi:MAG: pilus assembly protein TadG-related protein [Anaerolineae bacterium]
MMEVQDKDGKARQEGQVVVIAALVLVGLLALLGLVLDGGLLYLTRRQAQNAADAAAWAGAYSLAAGSREQAITSALYYADLNGFNNDGIHNRVTVSHPPDAGVYTGNPDFLRVTIAVTKPTYLIHLVYGGASTVSASATAGFVVTPSSGREVLVLDPSACNAAYLSGSVLLEILDGGLMVNSSCRQALYVGGMSRLSASDYIHVNGGYWISWGARVDPPPVTGVPPSPDPLAGLPPPDLGSMPIRHGSPWDPDTLRIVHGSVTLEPGVYYGGIAIAGDARVTLRPGLYAMAGGGFSVGGMAQVKGEGVCLYNGVNPYARRRDDAFGSVVVTNSGLLSLTPPKSGPYAGLVVFQDRTNEEEMSVSGAARLSAPEGTLYLPSARLAVSGGAQSNAPFLVLRLSVSGSARVSVRPRLGGGGGGTTDVFLAE